MWHLRSARWKFKETLKILFPLSLFNIIIVAPMVNISDFIMSAHDEISISLDAAIAFQSCCRVSFARERDWSSETFLKIWKRGNNLQIITLSNNHKSIFFLQQWRDGKLRNVVIFILYDFREGVEWKIFLIEYTRRATRSAQSVSEWENEKTL